MSSKGRVNPPRKCKIKNTVPARGKYETPEALLNDVVLENIFKFLAYKDLQSCRQVGNCQWLRDSKKAWWAQTKVKLEQIEGGHNHILKYFIETVINSNATNYKLEGIQGNYFGFWERLGHSIKYLELSCCTFYSSEFFRQIIYTLCPNLEKLVTFDISFETETAIQEPTEWEEPHLESQNSLKYVDLVLPKRMPMSWMEFLSHYPKLQFLKAVVHTVDLFKAISMIRQHDPKMLNLKHIEIRDLSLQSDYDESIRLVFLDPKLSLETIRIDAGKCQPETLLDILDLHAKSLKKLILDGHGNRHPTLRYPRQPLQFLEELQVSHCVFPADIFKFTPNVRKVNIRLHNPSRYPILERVEPSVRVNTCKDLTLSVEGEWKDTRNSDFVFFLRAFPNVETLHTGELTNRKFSLICEHLTKLVSFIVYISFVDVAGLLGFDPDSKADSGNRKPKIANLKDLQSFSLEKYLASRIEMKNGREVFKELKKLLHLKKFELKNYKGDELVWKKIFAEYSGH